MLDKAIEEGIWMGDDGRLIIEAAAPFWGMAAEEKLVKLTEWQRMIPQALQWGFVLHMMLGGRPAAAAVRAGLVSADDNPFLSEAERQFCREALLRLQESERTHRERI